MKVQTRVFGEIEISENQKIFIEEGLYIYVGFNQSL